MAAIKTSFGSGGANIAPNDAQGTPTLAEALRDIADDLVGVGTVPAWLSGLPVLANTAMLPTAGYVLAVEGSVGGVPGGKSIVFGAPAAGEVRVAYDAAGVPTLNFSPADAIVQCAVVQFPFAPLKTIKA